MNRSYSPPEFLDMIKLLLPLELEWEGKRCTIDELRKKAVNDCAENRKQDRVTIYNRFTSALLEGFRTKGKDYGLRINLMNEYIKDFPDVTLGNIQTILNENNYSLKTRGTDVILGARNIVEPTSFQWEHYFLEAETNYTNGFLRDNKFLRIKGVGNKVRDFALSEFSTCYCAIDSHLADVIRRTGLLLYGYGQKDFGTSPTENYSFLQRLIIQFSKDTGWSLESAIGYSPKEIDAILWFFGNEKGICRGNPECFRCPIKELCLTFQNWKGTPIKPTSELRRERQEEQRQVGKLIREYVKEHPEQVEEIKKKHGL